MQIKNILRNSGALCAFLVLTLAVANIINSLVLHFGAFLAALPKSSTMSLPLPNWLSSVFLYLTVCAAWLIWMKNSSFFSSSLRWYYAQLLFNILAAVVLYFQSVPLIILFSALSIICALQATRLFYREDKIAALLMVPQILVACNGILSFAYPLFMSM